MKNWVAEGIASDINDFTPQAPPSSDSTAVPWRIGRLFALSEALIAIIFTDLVFHLVIIGLHQFSSKT